MLLTFHAGRMTALSVIGGRNIGGEVQRLRAGGGGVSVDILVGTPGRLVDHIQTTAGFVEALRGLKLLVLDEADRLLDMGCVEAERLSGRLNGRGGGGVNKTGLDKVRG